jgi:hypothetical protein
MHHKVRFERLKALQNGPAIPDIHLMMMEVLVHRLQPLLVPAGVTLGTEKVGAHVVVNSMHLPTEFAEIVDHFRADEP